MSNREVTIIGLGHRKRQGKSWCAEKLAGQLMDAGVLVQVRGFATAIKQLAEELGGTQGLKPEAFYEVHPGLRLLTLGGEVHKTPREIWSETGAAMREVFGPKVWVWSLLQRWLPRQMENNPFEVLLIPDLRYPEEMRAIHDGGGQCIQVDRTEYCLTLDEDDEALDGITTLAAGYQLGTLPDGLWWDAVWDAPDKKLGDLEGYVSQFAQEILKSLGVR